MQALMAKSVVNPIDYDVMHKHFGHASKEVLRHLKDATKNYPKGVVVPITTKLCKGCAEGKMPS